MARNKYDVDEELEEKYRKGSMTRALQYAKPYAWKMVLVLLISCFASLLSLLSPTLIQQAMDIAMPNKDMGMLIRLSIILTVAIITSTLCGALRGIIMANVGQSFIYDLRCDVFSHLQRLPFAYYDSRPQGKILVRVVNYVNNVSDMMTNGIINAIMECLNLVFIMLFMFMMHWQLALLVLTGVPVLLGFVYLIKPRQRKTRLINNNKSSNLTAYTCESIDGVKVSQIFNRQGVNEGIYEKLSRAARKAFMDTVYISNTMWLASQNISRTHLAYKHRSLFYTLGGILGKLLNIHIKGCYHSLSEGGINRFSHSLHTGKNISVSVGSIAYLVVFLTVKNIIKGLLYTRNPVSRGIGVSNKLNGEL